MSTFIEAYKRGQQGANKGLPMGDGLRSVSRSVNNLQRAMIYGVAAPPKGGKSTFVDAGFVIDPIVYILDNNSKYKNFLDSGLTPHEIKFLHGIDYIDAEFIYNSYEIDRISKEFDFVAHFINKDYGVERIRLNEGVTCNGQDTIEVSASYLRGRILDDNEKLIEVKPAIFELVKDIYVRRIIPLFGEFAIDGTQISKGIITFLEQKENPTGIRNYLIDYAKRNGTVRVITFKGSDGKMHDKIVGYTPNNPDKYVFVITDHVRKLVRERGFSLKETVDKFSEYAVECKNLFGFSFVHIIHLNRSMTDTQRLKYQEDMIYPNSDDVKETGNLAEDCDFFFTMFNPNDDRYGLSKHFGTVIKDRHKNLLFPYMRTIHLVESRHTIYPRHFRVNMYGNIKKFEQLTINENGK